MTPFSNGRFRVLVVDDDPSVLACYQRLLNRAGYTTMTESDPRALLGSGDSRDADLIVLDYKMPGMDGLSLLAELRHRECQARCILISAYVNDDVRAQARRLGVDHVLDKPVDIDRLRSVIGQLLPVSGQHVNP